jgi:hypothetical protein
VLGEDGHVRAVAVTNGGCKPVGTCGIETASTLMSRWFRAALRRARPSAESVTHHKSSGKLAVPRSVGGHALANVM